MKLQLQEISRKKPYLENRVDAHIEQAAVDVATEQPACGQVRMSYELRQQCILVSLGGMRSILSNQVFSITPVVAANAQMPFWNIWRSFGATIDVM